MAITKQAWNSTHLGYLVLSTLTVFLSCQTVAVRLPLASWRILCSPLTIFPGFFRSCGKPFLLVLTVPQAILFQILHQFHWSEIIVEVQMVVLVLETLRQSGHNIVSKTILQGLLSLFAKVHIKFTEISILSITPHPDLDSPLDRFGWQVLFIAQATCVGYHSLIDALVLVWPIDLLEICSDVI